MFAYGNNSNASYTTEGDMIKILNVSKMDSFPLYNLVYEINPIKRYDNKKCKEFEGDCLKFVQTNFIMKFE